MKIKITEYDDYNSEVCFDEEIGKGNKRAYLEIQVGKQLYQIREAYYRNGLRIIPVGGTDRKENGMRYRPIVIPNVQEVTVTTEPDITGE